MVINVSFIIQCIAIVAGLFGVIASIVSLCSNSLTFVGLVRFIYTFALSGILLSLEIYIMPFMKYFGFMLKTWGKGLTYLFVGALLFASKGFQLFCSILYWILAIAFGIVAFFFPLAAPPLLQGGVKENPRPELSVKSSELYTKKDAE